MDRADAVGAAQVRITRKMAVNGEPADQFRNFRNSINDFVCNLKGGMFPVHVYLTVRFITHIIAYIAHFINQTIRLNERCKRFRRLSK